MVHSSFCSRRWIYFRVWISDFSAGHDRAEFSHHLVSLCYDFRVPKLYSSGVGGMCETQGWYAGVRGTWGSLAQLGGHMESFGGHRDRVTGNRVTLLWGPKLSCRLPSPSSQGVPAVGCSWWAVRLCSIETALVSVILGVFQKVNAKGLSNQLSKTPCVVSKRVQIALKGTPNFKKYLEA